MAITTTDDMGLVKPEVTSENSLGTPAQDWAIYTNNNFVQIDSHNHAADTGVQISSDNLILDDFDLNNKEFYNVSYFSFTGLGSAPSTACSYYADGDGDLHYIDESLSDIQITKDGSINIEDTTGGFTGDYGDDGSKAVFYGSPASFIFYGTDSDSIANLSCKKLVSTETGSSIDDLSGGLNSSSAVCTFENLKGKSINPISGEWISVYSDTSGKTLSYPYIGARDVYGGTSISPHDPTSILYNEQQYFYGDKNNGYYVNDSSTYPDIPNNVSVRKEYEDLYLDTEGDPSEYITFPPETLTTRKPYFNVYIRTQFRPLQQGVFPEKILLKRGFEFVYVNSDGQDPFNSSYSSIYRFPIYQLTEIVGELWTTIMFYFDYSSDGTIYSNLVTTNTSGAHTSYTPRLYVYSIYLNEDRA